MEFLPYILMGRGGGISDQQNEADCRRPSDNNS